MTDIKPVTRFCPLPTGFAYWRRTRRCSIGLLRVIMAARFLLRIEDTDRARSTRRKRLTPFSTA